MKKYIIAILIFFHSAYIVKGQVDFKWGKQIRSDGDEKTRNLIIDSFNGSGQLLYNFFGYLLANKRLL